MNYFIRILVLTFVSIVLLSSCGEKVEELQNTMEVMKNLPDAAEKMEETTNLAEKKIQERKAKGDTLAMNFKDLMLYLPASIDGFTAEEPDGSTTNAMGFSFSQASKTYKKTVGGNQQTIRIELIDYNASYAMLSGVAYWTNLEISTENANGYERTVKTNIENAFAYEKYSKEGKNGTMMYVLGYRFILNIEGNFIDNTDILKSVAGKIDLKKLASF